MTAGLGVDMVDIRRIERALDRHPRLSRRLFTDGEREYAATYHSPARPLAARFAAKEAVVKALTLPPGTSLREIEVVAGRPPEIKLHGAVRREAEERNLELKVSLSHEREFAIAVVVADTVG